VSAPAASGDTAQLSAAVKDVGRHLRRIAGLELELARAEAREKARWFGAAAISAIVAAVLGLFGLGFALASAASGLDHVLPTWLSLLCVAAGLAVGAAVLALAASRSGRRALPAKPEQALAEAKETAHAVRNGDRKASEA
jgi:hypothetical protein